MVADIYAMASAATERGEVPYDCIPLSDSLAAAVAEGQRLARERNEPFIEGDLATGCQDSQSVADLFLSTTSAPADGQASVRASFMLDGRPREMNFSLVETPQGWKVDNITSPEGYDLRASVTSYVADASQSCEQERGLEAAQRLVDQCIAVSPATHPPCNVRNHCGLIGSEILRNCPTDDPTPSESCRPL